VAHQAAQARGARHAPPDEARLANAGQEGERNARDERDDGVVEQCARAISRGCVGRGWLLAGRDRGVECLGDVGSPAKQTVKSQPWIPLRGPGFVGIMLTSRIRKGTRPSTRTAARRRPS